MSLRIRARKSCGRKEEADLDSGSKTGRSMRKEWRSAPLGMSMSTRSRTTSIRSYEFMKNQHEDLVALQAALEKNCIEASMKECENQLRKNW